MVIVLCALFALMLSLIVVTVFFIIHNNKNIFGYHKFEKYKKEKCMEVLNKS